MGVPERKFMERAIQAARMCKGNPDDPLVGAVAVLHGKEVGIAYRGQFEAGEHAEYTLLEKHLANLPLVGATIYTTLEPCTNRNPGKIPCVDRLIERKVGRVVIGLLDPNSIIRGDGHLKLRKAGISVGKFPNELMSELEELNCHFIQAMEVNAVNQTCKDILNLAQRSGTPRQRDASAHVLKGCLKNLRRIHEGQIAIPGLEAGYFARLIEAIDSTSSTEYVKAFIRLIAFDPSELAGKTWFEQFYEELDARVRKGKLEIEYIFLVRGPSPEGPAEKFISRYKRFAKKISIVCQSDPRSSPEIIRPSVVVLEKQEIAFTHDRGDSSALIEATEWVSPESFKRLSGQIAAIELISSVFFRKK
ncbi:MAG: hypothetical protein ACRD3E_02645 [Terriglobales bacterium]